MIDLHAQIFMAQQCRGHQAYGDGSVGIMKAFTVKQTA